MIESARQESEVNKPHRMAWLSFGLSFFVPGLGHMVSSYAKRGLCWLLVAVCVNVLSMLILVSPNLVRWFFVAIPLIILMSIVIIVDAVRCGRHSKRLTFQRSTQRVLVGLLTPVVAIFLSPYGWFNYVMARHHVEAFVIAGQSMKPTLFSDDKVLSYKGVTSQRWSIVTYRSPDTGGTNVGRVVGLPGEKVEIVDGSIAINGSKVRSPNEIGPYTDPKYLPRGARTQRGLFQLGMDEYYILGDNSEHAYDSRYWQTSFEGHQIGALPLKGITGGVLYRYWPPERWGPLVNEEQSN